MDPFAGRVPPLSGQRPDAWQVCTSHCLTKFVHPANDKPYEKDGCLQCDEYSSGPAFIKCAGANRRSSGIISDIDRGPGQVCPVGYCSGKARCFGE